MNQEQGAAAGQLQTDVVVVPLHPPEPIVDPRPDGELWAVPVPSGETAEAVVGNLDRWFEEYVVVLKLQGQGDFLGQCM